MRRITAIAILVLVVSLAASALMVRHIDHLAADATLEEVLYIPSARVLKRLSLGYNTLLANIYWTRAVQYFGTQHHDRTARYELLYPLLDITTDLDPQLRVAYQFGSIFLAQNSPEGAGQPHLAVALVEKGIRQNPQDWKLYYNLGWILASELKNYQAASSVFERGSKIEGSNPAMKVLAAAMAQHGGDLETARLMWAQIYETTENEAIRVNAIKRLEALKVDGDVLRLEQAVEAYQRAAGRVPRSWAELQATGWRGPVIDPSGRPYRIMPDGRVEVADPDKLPFITRGLPPGQAPSLTPSTASQIEDMKSLKEKMADTPPPQPKPRSER
jgi:tetratricopeptide (TPR) repeat protein